jgi:hypothetical protein
MNKIVLSLCIASLLPVTASALEGQVSGFGTAGVSGSNNSVSYDRGVNNINPDWIGESKLGLQADVKLSNKLSMTGQVVAKQSDTDDGKMAVQGEWLFGAYAFNDSTKIRAGKLRLPLFMMSEQLDVGKAYTLAKLPLEMYGQAPTNGYTGVDAIKTFEVGEDGELIIQPYAGLTNFTGRSVNNQAAPDSSNNYPTGFSNFEAGNLAGLNFVFNYNEMLRLRAGYMKATLTSNNPQMTSVQANPYGLITGDYVHNVDASFSSVGAELKLGKTNITAEYGQRRVASMMFADTDGRYVTVSHQLGAFTPYAYYAEITSDKTKSVAGQSNIGVNNLHQHTTAAGVVYAIDGKSNVKAEASQVSVASDNNSNEFFNNATAMQGKDINVYRLNYNLMF